MRRFYGFNSVQDVEGHISQVITQDDLLQLQRDIQASGTNLTRFRSGALGVWAIDCAAGDTPKRYIFMTKDAHEKLGDPAPHEADYWKVLEI